MKRKKKESYTVFIVGIIIWSVNLIVDIAFPNRKNRTEKMVIDSCFLLFWSTFLATRLIKRKKLR